VLLKFNGINYTKLLRDKKQVDEKERSYKLGIARVYKLNLISLKILTQISRKSREV